jgi:hypothetical protein
VGRRVLTPSHVERRHQQRRRPSSDQVNYGLCVNFTVTAANSFQTLIFSVERTSPSRHRGEILQFH